MLSAWEDEVKRQEAEREAVRLEKCSAVEEALLADEEDAVELVSIDLRNGLDSKSTALKQLTGFTASMGIVFDDMNGVKAVTQGGTALVDGVLRMGDIVVAADGAPLKGIKVDLALAALDLPTCVDATRTATWTAALPCTLW